MTCTICGNAHTGECSVAALKARIERLDHRVGVLNTRERMVLDELGFAEDVSPVWGAVLLNIRDLRGRVKVGEAERDALRAQIAEAELTLLNERGEGEPPEPGWTWYVSGEVREWRRGGERVIPAHPGRWEVHAHGRERITRATAREAIIAAKATREG